MKDKPKKDNKIKDIVSFLQKQYGDHSVGMAGEMDLIIKRVSTGSQLLDLKLGGGLPLGRTVELFGQPHCLDENTFIPYRVVDKNNKIQNHKGGTIKNLYNRFHNIKTSGRGCYQRKQTINSSFQVLSIRDDDFIISNKIKDVIYCGKKKCYEVVTIDNKKIITTKDHKFYIGNNKYKKLKDLKIGDYIFTHNNTRYKNKKITRYKEVLVKYHPTWRTKKVCGHKYYRNRIADAVIEAKLNNLSYKKYIDLLNSDRKIKIKTIPNGYVVHHKDNNYKNDNIKNLELITVKKHKQLHQKTNKVFSSGGFIATETKIKSIKFVDNRETYDISCQSPFNNYIANKFVVHNSGKTLISLRTIKAAQNKNMSCAFIDAEGSYDPKFAERIGVDNNKLIFIRESEGDKVFTILQELIERGVEIIVVDSIASITPTYELEEDFNKNTIGIHARMMSKALRKLTGLISKNNSLIIFLNQIREKVGAYGNPEISTGGRALGFYASVRIEVRAKIEKEGKEKTHQMVKWAIVKNKAGNPHGYGEFIYHYKNGINYDDELLLFLLETKQVKKSGSFYQILGQQFHGRKEFYEKLKSDPKFKEELLKL